MKQAVRVNPAGGPLPPAQDPVPGAFSVLLPGQHTELLPDMGTAEHGHCGGPLHFAGCHTLLKPAWIEGALDSAVRAALEVHTH
ncbi:hypothetical protein GCM10010381_21820 [Streptomyces xantholiticus]|nr:FAD-dependent oxidoreductase [Streptomyces xantholiticus]GGW36798.1 hypothetical protein GCM10010381_21820 [Streptomyces xantholiticus]